MLKPESKILSILVFLITAFFFVLPETNAQYFGRNKVQYDDFDFEMIKTANFDLYYYEKESDIAVDAVSMLERWGYRLGQIFGDTLLLNQKVIIYANHPDFQQSNVISGIIPQGTGGVTEGMQNRVILPMTGIYSENNHVLGHELVHTYHYNLMNINSTQRRRQARIPLWFIEGMSEYYSIGRKKALTSMWMRDAVLNDDVPTFSEISQNRKYFPYRYGHSILSFIAAEWGDRAPQLLFRTALKTGWDSSFTYVFGIDKDSLSTLWQNAIEENYERQLENKITPGKTGNQIIPPDGINLSPSLSPDGKYIALFSRQELFTLDLYLADAETGEIVRQLASSSTDEHFDAMRFMNSSGAWSPDAEKFAFITIAEGDNEIAIVDVEKGGIEKTYTMGRVNAATSLDWSPDGSSLLISGTDGGVGDLYLMDLESGNITALTDDRYAEIQPQFSPDGSKIVFATDRGSTTNFSLYNFGSMKLAVLDLETDKMELIAVTDYNKHINPFYSDDGEDIYFIADPDGYSNIFRYNISSGNFYKVTNIATGVSGFTELSPALTVAGENDRMVFSVFEQGSYAIHELEAEKVQQAYVTPDREEYLSVVSMPPVHKTSEGVVEAYLENPQAGLPSGDRFNYTDYSPDLSLVYAGSNGIGVTVDRFGAGLGGGVNLIFGDVLGDHMINTIAQVNGTLKDIGGQVTYLNRSSRFIWGAAIGHIPYRTAAVRRGLDTVTVDGQRYLAQEDNLIIQRIYNDQLSLLTHYPLSRNRRLEFSAGYSRISYDFELRRLVTLGTRIIEEEERELDAPPALNLFKGSAAFVGDYSFFGFTSPVEGSRYRFEVEPTTGSLDFVSILADFRKYFFADPFTFAVRGLHYGRYFGDSESDRLSPLQVGFDTWVRGYDISTFEVSECSGTNPNNCPEIERLYGSKAAIFNFEIRVPLFGTEQFGLVNAFIPTELTAFIDAGTAWTDNSTPVLEWATESTKRIPVFSAGGALRFNLLGMAIVQTYYAFPFQRPDKTGVFGFVIAPGW